MSCIFHLLLSLTVSLSTCLHNCLDDKCLPARGAVVVVVLPTTTSSFLPSLPASVISGGTIVWQRAKQAVIKELKLDHN